MEIGDCSAISGPCVEINDFINQNVSYYIEQIK